ncbi:MAG: tetratricopeptide repeat protein [Bacteroidales bacterium]|nr:tetratricopeptide repeat protein [Bacteroidales bacterium]
MRFVFIIILLLSSSGLAWSQSSPDSLVSLNCSEKIKVYQDAGNRFKNFQLDSAIKYYDLAYQQALLCSDNEKAAECVNVMGIVYFEKNEFSSALEKFETALSLSNDDLNRAIYLLNISDIYIELGDYTDALKILDELLVVFQQLDFDKGISATYGNIAKIYKQIGNIDTALCLYRNSISYFHSDSNLKPSIYIDIAECYIEAGNYEMAFEFLIDAEEILQTTNNLSILGDVYSIFGNLYTAKGNYYLAVDFYTKSIFLYKKINSKNKLVSQFIKLSHVYILQNYNENANFYLDSAKHYIDISTSLEIVENFYFEKYYFYNSTRNVDSAFFYYLSFDKIRDSIEHFKNENLLSLKNYQLEKQEKTKIEIKVQNDKNNFIYLLIVSILLLVLTVGFFIFGFRQRFLRRRNKEYLVKYATTSADLRYSNTKIQAQAIAFLALQKATDPEKDLKILMQEILEEILNLSFLKLQHKGCILLLQPSGKLETFASVNLDAKVINCSLINSDYCLCGKAFTENRIITTKNIEESILLGHIDNREIDHGHYIAPLVWQNDKLGVINFYLRRNQVLSEIEIDFLNNFTLTISGIIKQKLDSILVAKRVKDQNVFSQKMFAQSLLIEQQKFEVEQFSERLEKQSILLKDSIVSIQDSINYASYILTALLPNKKTIDSLLENYFLLFKPKDVVGGDFYFVSKENEHLLIVLADATGHGVPGAFLTTLGLTFLKEIVKKYDISNPALLLEVLRKNIKEVFMNSDIGISFSGYDMGIVSINEKTNKLCYSGALMPLYIVRRKEMIKFKANRSPIANYYIEEDFVNKEFIIEENDTIYLFSDGFPDQFGGDNNTKYTRKKFIKLLTDISDKKIKKQEEIIFFEFEKWIKDYEQTDDVTVLGLKWKEVTLPS